jgi:hypothetical protein
MSYKAIGTEPTCAQPLYPNVCNHIMSRFSHTKVSHFSFVNPAAN